MLFRPGYRRGAVAQGAILVTVLLILVPLLPVAILLFTRERRQESLEQRPPPFSLVHPEGFLPSSASSPSEDPLAQLPRQNETQLLQPLRPAQRPPSSQQQTQEGLSHLFPRQQRGREAKPPQPRLQSQPPTQEPLPQKPLGIPRPQRDLEQNGSSPSPQQLLMALQTSSSRPPSASSLPLATASPFAAQLSAGVEDVQAAAQKQLLLRQQLFRQYMQSPMAAAPWLTFAADASSPTEGSDALFVPPSQSEALRHRPAPSASTAASARRPLLPGLGPLEEGEEEGEEESEEEGVLSEHALLSEEAEAAALSAALSGGHASALSSHSSSSHEVPLQTGPSDASGLSSLTDIRASELQQPPRANPLPQREPAALLLLSASRPSSHHSSAKDETFASVAAKPRKSSAQTAAGEGRRSPSPSSSLSALNALSDSPSSSAAVASSPPPADADDGGMHSWPLDALSGSDEGAGGGEAEKLKVHSAASAPPAAATKAPEAAASVSADGNSSSSGNSNSETREGGVGAALHPWRQPRLSGILLQAAPSDQPLQQLLLQFDEGAPAFASLSSPQRLEASAQTTEATAASPAAAASVQSLLIQRQREQLQRQREMMEELQRQVALQQDLLLHAQRQQQLLQRQQLQQQLQIAHAAEKQQIQHELWRRSQLLQHSQSHEASPLEVGDVHPTALG